QEGFVVETLQLRWCTVLEQVNNSFRLWCKMWHSRDGHAFLVTNSIKEARNQYRSQGYASEAEAHLTEKVTSVNVKPAFKKLVHVWLLLLLYRFIHIVQRTDYLHQCRGSSHVVRLRVFVFSRYQSLLSLLRVALIEFLLTFVRLREDVHFLRGRLATQNQTCCFGDFVFNREILKHKSLSKHARCFQYHRIVQHDQGLKRSIRRNPANLALIAVAG